MRYIPSSVTISASKASERILPQLKPRLHYTLINIRRKKETVDGKEVVKHEYMFREKPDPIVLKDPRLLHYTSFTVNSYEEGDAAIDKMLNLRDQSVTRDASNPEVIEKNRIEKRARLNSVANNVFSKRRRF